MQDLPRNPGHKMADPTHQLKSPPKHSQAHRKGCSCCLRRSRAQGRRSQAHAHLFILSFLVPTFPGVHRSIPSSAARGAFQSTWGMAHRNVSNRHEASTHMHPGDHTREGKAFQSHSAGAPHDHEVQLQSPRGLRQCQWLPSKKLLFQGVALTVDPITRVPSLLLCRPCFYRLVLSYNHVKN